MATFLQELAQKLLKDHDNDLSQLVVMFPSQRARVFFNDAIGESTDTPTWQPHYTSIDEIMVQASGYTIGDRIKLIVELYKVYLKKFPNESFDRFYHWGEVLISDFDMIDKYMIDADNLLVNIKDIKEIEADLSYLTEEQQRIIMTFWSNVHSNDTPSEQKQRFLEVWNALPYIYHEYRRVLKDQKIGYAGFIYRAAADRIKHNGSIELESKKYIIAGFNALSESERILFDYISKSEHGAEFYWDYDNYYVANDKIKKHEAGKFLRDNISKFPSQSPLSHDNFKAINKDISVTACVSNIAQVKHISSILQSIPEHERNKNTAIVLTDENLLEPLLHALPEIDNINVTMGYPFKNTLAYSFIDTLLTLQSHGRPKDESSLFYHKDVTWTLSHPYITDICPTEARNKATKIRKERIVTVENSLFADSDILAKLFVKHDKWTALSDYIIESLNTVSKGIIKKYTKDPDVEDNIAEVTLTDEDSRTIEHIHLATQEIAEFTRLINDCKDIKEGEQETFKVEEISCELFTSILRRHLQTIKIPYEGEPLNGIQVLGILETRNIDFKNVIILSMTDANFPGNHADKASFIPYSLRFAHSMPTPEEHEAMYAYYFYRLLQRAKRINMLYCSRADDKSTGECSRYIYQLDFESGYTINKNALGVDLCVEEDLTIEIKKGDKEMAILSRYTDDSEDSLSPTALHRYIECPLKFYFASVAKIRSSNELTDKIDSLTFGNILHKSMEILYEPFQDKKNPMQKIAELRNEEAIKRVVNDVIISELHKTSKITDNDFNGDTLLVRDIIVKYILKGILRHDIERENEGYTIVAREKHIPLRYVVNPNLSVKLEGVADRIDLLSNGMLQVIDYKSSKAPSLEFSTITNLFHGESAQRISNIFQTFLYSMIIYKTRGKMILKDAECKDVVPSLYYASHMSDNKYSPLIVNKIPQYDEVTGKKKPQSLHETIECYSMIANEFEYELNATLEEIFNKDIPFKQIEDKKTCERCDYKKICRQLNEPEF